LNAVSNISGKLSATLMAWFNKREIKEIPIFTNNSQYYLISQHIVLRYLHSRNIETLNRI